MFKSIVELGKLTSSNPQIMKHASSFNPLSLYYLFPAENIEEVQQVVAIKWNKDGQYVGLNITDFKVENISKYMHVKAVGSSRIPVWSPSYIVSVKTIDSDDNIFKIIGQHMTNIFKEIKHITNISLDSISSLKDSNTINTIINDLKIRYSSKSEEKNKKILLIFQFEIGGKYLYPGEIKEISSAILNKINELKSTTRKGVCSLCHQYQSIVEKPIMISGWQFFTANNENYITNANGDNTHIHFPICPDCYEYLNIGCTYIKENFDFTFLTKQKNSVNYYLIPSFLSSNNEEIQEEIIQIINEMTSSLNQQNKSSGLSLLSEDYKNEILDLLREKPDFLILHFLFHHKKGNSSQVSVYLHIPDVYPSRIHRLFEIKAIIEKLFTYVTETEVKNYQFFYSKIYSFSYYKNFILDNKTIYTILYNTFKEIEIENQILFSFFMKKINKMFLDSQSSNFSIFKTTMDAFASYFYILLTTKGGNMEQSNLNCSLESLEDASNVEDFLNRTFLSSPEQRGLFLLGVLIGRVLAAQSQDNKNKPFFKKLKGMRLTLRDIQGLLGETINKLQEYQKFSSYQPIYILASSYLLQANLEKQSKLSIDELNFYLSLGIGQGIIKNTPFLKVYSKERPFVKKVLDEEPLDETEDTNENESTTEDSTETEN